MKTNNVYIVGSAFLDHFTILHNGKYIEYNQMGGIHNIDNIGNHKIVNYNSAHFVINKYGTDSYIDWGCINDIEIYKEYFNHIQTPDWIHFSYLNTIPKLKLGAGTFPAKTTSCDISEINHPDITDDEVIENIKHCNIVFMSALAKNSLKFIKYANIYLVMHYPSGSIIYFNQNKISSYANERGAFPITVGAGDKFAGFFIEELLESGLMEKAQKIAHTKTIEWLTKYNKEIFNEKV